MSRRRNHNKLRGILPRYHAQGPPGPVAAPARAALSCGLDGRPPALSRRWHTADPLLYLVGVPGLSFAITNIWLGMRFVMDIAGSCASGEAYEIATLFRAASSSCSPWASDGCRLGRPDGLEGLPIGRHLCRLGGTCLARAVPVTRLELPGVRGPQPIRRRRGSGLADPGCHLRGHGRGAARWLVRRSRPGSRGAWGSLDHDPHPIGQLAAAMRQAADFRD